MSSVETVQIVGIIASIALPLFNIPLILKIKKRGSSKDFSLTWAFGIWSCILLMIPSTLVSPDFVFKVFGLTNFFLFSIVVLFILKYRKS